MLATNLHFNRQTKWRNGFTRVNSLYFLAQHVVVSWNFYSKSVYATEIWRDGVRLDPNTRGSVCMYSVHQTQFKNEVKYPFFIVSAYVFPYIIVPPFDFLYFVGMNHCLSLHMIQTFICYSIQVLKARRNFAPYQTAHCQDMANWEGEKKQSTEK